MASYKPPFMSSDMKNLKRSIISGIYKRIPNLYSDNLEQFIRMCLNIDPSTRCSA